MNIYLISQRAKCGYDTFDSAVVIAESEEEAKKIHPHGGEYPKCYPDDTDKCLKWDYEYGTWAPSPELVNAEQIGVANEDETKPRVVCASFNAG